MQRQIDHSPPERVYVLVRDDGTIAGINRDKFEPPRSHVDNWSVHEYVLAPYGAEADALREKLGLA